MINLKIWYITKETYKNILVEICLLIRDLIKIDSPKLLEI